MGRALLVLESQADRQKAMHWITKAPEGTRVEFKASKRSLPQNDLMWALLTEFAQKFAHNGKKYDPSEWKCIFLHAFGREISFLPSLDGRTFLPIEMSSSDLSKEEMTDFIEFIIKEAAERGIILSNSNNTESGSSPSSEPVNAEASPLTSAASDDGESSPLLSDALYSEWLLNITKMLWGATNVGGDLSVLRNQKIAAIASHPKPEGCPKAISEKAESIFSCCKQIVDASLEKEDGLAMIAGILGCDQDDIGRAA